MHDRSEIHVGIVVCRGAQKESRGAQIDGMVHSEELLASEQLAPHNSAFGVQWAQGAVRTSVTLLLFTSRFGSVHLCLAGQTVQIESDLEDEADRRVQKGW